MSDLNYALIIDNKVAGIMQVDPKGISEPGLFWVEFNPKEVKCEVGFVYNPSNNTFERPRLSIAEEKAELLELINFYADQKMTPVLGGFPESERLTFFVQYIEAMFLLQGQQSPLGTIFLPTLANKRHISNEELLQRVVKQSKMFAYVSATVLGERQAHEDNLKAITTYKEIDELRARVEAWAKESIA